MIKTGNLRVVFGDGEDSLIGDGKGEAIEMRIHKVPGPKRVGGVSLLKYLRSLTGSMGL